MFLLVLAHLSGAGQSPAVNGCSNHVLVYSLSSNTKIIKINDNILQEPKKQVFPKVIWEELHYHPSQQRMSSPTACATICAMFTADMSNHSVTGMLQPHRSATFLLYVTLRCPILPTTKSVPFPIGDIHLTRKKSSFG